MSSIARLDQKSVGDLIKSGKDTSVKNLEALLKQKEGRGGEIISSRKLIQSKIVLQIGKLSLQQREKFLKELSSLKKEIWNQRLKKEVTSRSAVFLERTINNYF
ncbi:ParB-like protein [Leptospira interrogans serovar Canicola]|nr:ParB-like protein [Leptospira interrogans serovar Canicola]